MNLLAKVTLFLHNEINITKYDTISAFWFPNVVEKEYLCAQRFYTKY